MAQDTTPAIICYQGDGSNTVFSVPFDKGYYGEVKVLFVRRGLADYTYYPNTYTVSGRLYAWQNGGAKIYTHTPSPAVGAKTYNSQDIEQANTVSAIAGQTITVDSLVYSRAVQHDIANNLLLTWTGDMLEVGDFICIIRDTERGQPYIMPNNQKHIEMALDNLERQIQEVKDATDNSLKVDPSYDIADSHKMAPLDWLKSIIRCMDFSVRALRYNNGWLDYSLDDPNIADGSKTWTHLLNTDNVKNIKEVVTIDPETLRELHSLYYIDKYGVERLIAPDMSIIEEAIEKAELALETVNNHIQDKSNPHEVTKAQVGLGNCDNTADIDKPVIVKVTTMPVASADYLGKEYQYVGEPSADYTRGYVYECVNKTETNTFILFNPVGTGRLSFDYANHSVYELFERIAAILGTFSAEDVVSGSFKLDKVNELWYINGYDSDNNTLFTNFTVSGTGDEYSLDAFGFVYTFLFPDDYEEGHEEAFSIAQESHSVYSWERVNVQPVVDVVTSTSTTAALSANQGKLLQDQINELKSFGRYLSVWNCATGLAETNPPESPYTYRSGDYFLVGTVDSTTNYKPDGNSYVIGVASTTVETNAVKTNDIYMYDGTTWKLLENVQREIAEGLTNKNTAAGATNPIYDWIGTAAEFAAQNIATTHPDWLCFITDDAAPTMGIYTAAECDARFSTKTETSTLLATKANISADNFNDNGKTLISGLGRYSNRFEQLQVVHGASYTAPETGFFTLDAILANEAGNRLYLLLRNKIPYIFNNKTAGMVFGALNTYRQYTWVPVEKGDQVVITAQSTAAAPDFNLRFFYANGVPTESPTFTEVEYIEGTYNTQYIKSGIVTDSSMKIYCKIQNLGNSLNFGWGARNATYDGSQMSISATNQNIVIDWFGAAAADRWTVSTPVTSSDIFELTIENNVGILTKNGTNIATHTFTPTATITRELYITGFDNNGAIGTAGAKGRLYAFKIWDANNDLILDLVPAKDGSGVACVYNRVTDTLYYNQGIGTYTAGPEI